IVNRQERLDPAKKAFVAPGGLPEVLRPGGQVADLACGVEQHFFAGLRRGHGQPPRCWSNPSRTQCEKRGPNPEFLFCFREGCRFRADRRPAPPSGGGASSARKPSRFRRWRWKRRAPRRLEPW